MRPVVIPRKIKQNNSMRLDIRFSQEQAEDLFAFILAVVEHSFQRHGMWNRTEYEFKRRVRLLEERAVSLRHWLGYTIERIKDDMRPYLDAQLLGTKVETSERSSWGVDDGATFVVDKD
jgi:hypothetical protein